MNKMKGSKLSKIMAFDMKRGILDKILIIIEMVLCIVVISLAFTGVGGANFIKRTYGPFSQGFTINYSPASYYDENTGEYIYDQTDLDKIAKIVKENKIARVTYFDSALDSSINSTSIYGYNSTMREHANLKLYKGKTFSKVEGAEKEIILSYEFKDKYKIGEIITGEKLGLRKAEQNYKIIGFLRENLAIVSPWLGLFEGKHVGIVQDDTEIIYLTFSILMTDMSKNDFIEKYDLGNKTSNSDSDGFTLQTMQEYMEQSLSDQEQIISFMVMFTIIGLLLYFSSIVSSLVIKHNNNLQMNINLIKIGATKKELLFVKYINIFIITLLSAILGGVASAIIIPMFIATLPTYSTLSIGVIVLSILPVVVSYAVFELLELTFVYKHIKRGK